MQSVRSVGCLGSYPPSVTTRAREALGVACAIALVLLVLLGCGGPKTVKDPNGVEWLVVECSSTSRCYEAAGAQCPAGYVVGNAEVVGSETHSRAAAVGNGVAVGRSDTRVTREMMIRCKEAPDTGPPPMPPLNP